MEVIETIVVNLAVLVISGASALAIGQPLLSLLVRNRRV
jgi:hypothetical protein